MIGIHLKTNEFRFPKHGYQIWSKNSKQFFKNGKDYGIRKKANEFVIYEENPTVTLKNTVTIELPSRFYELDREVENSKYILALENDWDDEGSVAYQEATWKKAIQFTSNYAKWVFDETSRVIPTPKIAPGPNGSIDILWKSPNYRLLINIPDNLKKQASFYGDNYSTDTIEGTFNPSNFNQGLLLTILNLY